MLQVVISDKNVDISHPFLVGFELRWVLGREGFPFQLGATGCGASQLRDALTRGVGIFTARPAKRRAMSCPATRRSFYPPINYGMPSIKQVTKSLETRELLKKEKLMIQERLLISLLAHDFENLIEQKHV